MNPDNLLWIGIGSDYAYQLLIFKQRFIYNSNVIETLCASCARFKTYGMYFGRYKFYIQTLIGLFKYWQSNLRRGGLKRGGDYDGLEGEGENCLD